MKQSDRPATQQAYYDKHLRDPKAKAFYNSAAWKAARLVVLQRDHHLCQPCLRKPVPKITPADAVHHVKPLDEAPDLALNLDKLESICGACHNKEHPEKGTGEQAERSHKARIIVLEPNPEVI